MEWFTESLRTLNLDNLIMKTTDAPTEGEQPMPPYRRRVRMICTPNTGHPVLGVFLCDTVMNTRRCASNYIDKENGSRHQKE